MNMKASILQYEPSCTDWRCILNMHYDHIASLQEKNKPHAGHEEPGDEMTRTKNLSLDSEKHQLLFSWTDQIQNPPSKYSAPLMSILKYYTEITILYGLLIILTLLVSKLVLSKISAQV